MGRRGISSLSNCYKAMDAGLQLVSLYDKMLVLWGHMAVIRHDTGITGHIVKGHGAGIVRI